MKNRFSGKLAELFPGTAKAWLAFIGDGKAKSLERMKGKDLPEFLTPKHIRSTGVTCLDDVRMLLLNAGVEPPYCVRDEGTGETEYRIHTYCLSGAESVLMHAHHMHYCDRVVYKWVGYQRGQKRAKALWGVSVLLDIRHPVSLTESLADLYEGAVSSCAPLRRYCVLAQDPRLIPYVMECSEDTALSELALGTLNMKEFDEETATLRKRLEERAALRPILVDSRLDLTSKAVMEVFQEHAAYLVATELGGWSEMEGVRALVEAYLEGKIPSDL